jgi:hypothetical protein
MACTQTKYSILLGGVMQMDESSWSNDAQRGEAGQFASGFVQSKPSGNAYITHSHTIVKIVAL